MSGSGNAAREAGRVFRAAPMGVIRLATLPRAVAAITRVDLEPERDGYEDRLAGYLVEVTADPVVREALAVSSASLTDTIAKVEAGRAVERAKLERAVFAATRYLLRMTGRPTPFGLLAGVQRLEFADRAVARIGDRHHKSVRPDNAWLSGALDGIRRSPAVRDACRVVVNNLCVERGDRVILQYVRPAPGEQGPENRELTVRTNPLVRLIMRTARRPVGYADLRTAILGAFPEATPENVDRVLGQLIDKEILLTDLLARRDAPDLLDRINTQLAAVGEPGPAALRQIGGMLADYQAEDPGAGLKTWRSTLEAMDRLHQAGERSPVQVDLRVDAEVRLPHEVAREMADAGEALWRLAPPADGQPEMTDYHRAFLERYGLRASVPVLDLLDPHIGLGPPAGYLVPRGERTVQHHHDHDYPPEREDLLARIVQSGEDELVLDDELVDRLSHDETVPPTLSFDLCVEVHADSVEDLDRGEFRLHLSAGAGSVAAGGCRSCCYGSFPSARSRIRTATVSSTFASWRSRRTRTGSM